MIIIPDAEMPKSCADCPLEYDSICCRAFDIEFYPPEVYSYNDYCSQRHPDCKLRELVRCKDCKYYNPPFEVDGMEFEGDCDFHEWYHAAPGENDFCSRGVRKDV